MSSPCLFLLFVALTYGLGDFCYRTNVKMPHRVGLLGTNLCNLSPIDNALVQGQMYNVSWIIDARLPHMFCDSNHQHL